MTKEEILLEEFRAMMAEVFSSENMIKAFKNAKTRTVEIESAGFGKIYLPIDVYIADNYNITMDENEKLVFIKRDKPKPNKKKPETLPKYVFMLSENGDKSYLEYRDYSIESGHFLTGQVYYKEHGQWGVGFTIKENGDIFSDNKHCFSYLNNRPLIPCTKDEFKKGEK
jgi:hypothetical protein